MNALTHTSTATATTTDDSNRAVEVVATFGDAVVGVRHVSDPKGGRISTRTRALLAGGALALASSAIAFGLSAKIASDNASALERWTDAGRPAWSFRPDAAPRGTDGVVLGGSLLGLAALTWGLSRRRRELEPSTVSVGTGAGVDFAVELANDGAGAAFDLVAPTAGGAGFAAQIAPGMTGELVRGGATLPLPSAGTAIPMTADTRLRLKLGATTFHVQSVPAARREATAATFGLDNRAAAFIAASAVAHLGLLALMRTAPADQDTAQMSPEEVENLRMRATADSMEDKPVEQDPTETGQDGATDGANAARMALPSGTMGSDTARPDPGKRTVKSDGDPSVAREQALRAAKEAGILGSDRMSGDLFSSIAGEGDLTSGFDDVDFDGGWDGSGDGAPEGFGNGPSGFGPGGGGHDWNSVWSGNYDTISRGPNSGDGYNLDGDPNGGKPRRHKPTAPPAPKLSKPECSGDASCDPEIIRRYVKRNVSKIQYCYERQLLATPGLSGQVQAIFTVMPNGTVSQSSASGVHSEVSSCIADVISTIKFPKFDAPFQVKYAFTLRPTGS